MRVFGEIVNRGGRVIRRPRLLRLLDESPSRIITLVAPAGYGKTTLAQQWIEETGCRAAWCRTTPASGDVAASAGKIANAASEIVPGVGAAMKSRLRVSRSPADEGMVLGELLARDLQQWPPDAWLVIDDYQFAAEVPAAEAFFEAVLFGAPLNALLASRKRPGWATSRRLLYGETYELGRSLLAMDSDEADAVLSEGVGASLPGLLALAEGWPAVIGLAALTRISNLPESQVPEQLFDFLAQELHRALSLEARDGLSRMAAVSRVDPRVVLALLGPNASRIVAECWDAGLITRRANDVYEIHPLVRSFLDRARLPSGRLAQESIKSLVDIYIAHEDWDDALGLARYGSDYATVEKIVISALDPLMNEGRLQTLEDVIEVTRQQEYSSPILDLVEAEIAFRRARYDQSEALASRAARLLPNDHATRSRALFRAGHASFFADRTKRALDYAEQSRKAAANATDLTNALWLQFVGMTELELSGSQDVLEWLDDAATEDPHDVVRVATGRLIIADRWGKVANSLTAAEAAYWLLPRVADPMIRTSFYNMFGRVLIDSGNYARALEVSQQGLDDLHDARLDFALPHMLMPKSSAQLGLGQVANALDTADHAIDLAKDSHAKANCALLRARALIVFREFDDARRCLADHTTAVLDPATRGEILAHDAFAAACQGDATAAHAVVAKAREASATVQTAIVSLLATILASPSGSPRARLLREALSLTSKTEHIDYLVLATRAHNELCDLLSESTPPVDSTIGRALTLIREPVTREHRENSDELTPRENEVLEFVSLGMSNREIAQQLFISEVTVKAHVRHILAKLGARSRTEAAVLRMKEQSVTKQPG